MATADTAPALGFRPAHTDDALQDWCTVHNLVVPADLISLETARDRSQARLLEVAYLDGELVGCSTIRPPHDDLAVGSLIVRVLPECRERGIGTAMLARGLAHVRSLGATTVETVVWEPNASGLRFARRRGFVETERYEVPDLEGTWIDLRLDLSTPPGRNSSS